MVLRKNHFRSSLLKNNKRKRKINVPLSIHLTIVVEGFINHATEDKFTESCSRNKKKHDRYLSLDLPSTSARENTNFHSIALSIRRNQNFVFNHSAEETFLFAARKRLRQMKIAFGENIFEEKKDSQVAINFLFSVFVLMLLELHAKSEKNCAAFSTKLFFSNKKLLMKTHRRGKSMEK